MEGATPRPLPLKRTGRWPRDPQAPSPSEEGIGRGAIVAQALREAAAMLASTSDTPRLDAELVMAHALGVSRSDLLLRHMQASAPPGYPRLVARRLAHEPIAYILGEQEFFGLRFAVDPAVLIPRADSEALVNAALAARPDARRVLDCGTGSGALLLAVLSKLPDAKGVGIDRSRAALAIARRNARSLALAGRATMVLADWGRPATMAKFGARFDLVLANPPYVEDGAALTPDVAAHEPARALFAGAEGLDAYRALLPQLPALLAPGGLAFIEIGATQAEPVGAIAGKAGYRARLHRDLGGRPRVLELSPE